MAHPIITGKSCAVLAAFTGFFYFLSLAHRGPWTSKFDMPALTKNRLKGEPEFDSLFRPDTHPALVKDQ